MNAGISAVTLLIEVANHAMTPVAVSRLPIESVRATMVVLPRDDRPDGHPSALRSPPPATKIPGGGETEKGAR
ncbi:hypothetical protein GCM10027067_38330 [Pseudactinotalea suaedae]